MNDMEREMEDGPDLHTAMRALVGMRVGDYVIRDVHVVRRANPTKWELHCFSVTVDEWNKELAHYRPAPN